MRIAEEKGREGMKNEGLEGIPEHYESTLDLQPSDMPSPSPALHYLLSPYQQLLE